MNILVVNEMVVQTRVENGICRSAPAVCPHGTVLAAERTLITGFQAMVLAPFIDVVQLRFPRFVAPPVVLHLVQGSLHTACRVAGQIIINIVPVHFTVAFPIGRKESEEMKPLPECESVGIIC